MNRFKWAGALGLAMATLALAVYPAIASTVPAVTYQLAYATAGEGSWLGVRPQPSGSATLPVQYDCEPAESQYGFVVDDLPLQPAPVSVSGSVAPPAPSGTSPISWGFTGTSSKALGWPLADAQYTNTTEFALLPSTSVDVYGPASGIMQIDAQSNDPNTPSVWWEGIATLPTRNANHWTTITAGSVMFHWRSMDLQTTTARYVAGPSEDSTIDQFHADHPDIAATTAHVGFGCDGNSFRLQNIRTDSQMIVLGSFTNNLAPISGQWMVAGEHTRVSDVAMYVAGPTAQLMFRPATAATYTSVPAAVTGAFTNDVVCYAGPDPNGYSGNDHWCQTRPFYRDLAPTTNTIYRFIYAARDGVSAAASGFATIHVQTALSMSYPPSIAKGVPFSIRGTTYPTKPGGVVTLWGKNGTKTVALGTTKVNSLGAFKFSNSVGPGTWVLWVVIPKDSANEASKSAMRGYTVR